MQSTGIRSYFCLVFIPTLIVWIAPESAFYGGGFKVYVRFLFWMAGINIERQKSK